MKLIRKHPTPALALVTAVSFFFNFPDAIHGGTPPLFCLGLSLLYWCAWGWYAAAFGQDKGKRRFVLAWNGLTALIAAVSLNAEAVDDLLMAHTWWLYVVLLFLVGILLTPGNGLGWLFRSVPGVLAAEIICALALILLCLWKRRRHPADDESQRPALR